MQMHRQINLAIRKHRWMDVTKHFKQCVKQL